MDSKQLTRDELLTLGEEFASLFGSSASWLGVVTPEERAERARTNRGPSLFYVSLIAPDDILEVYMPSPKCDEHPLAASARDCDGLCYALASVIAASVAPTGCWRCGDEGEFEKIKNPGREQRRHAGVLNVLEYLIIGISDSLRRKERI